MTRKPNQNKRLHVSRISNLYSGGRLSLNTSRSPYKRAKGNHRCRRSHKLLEILSIKDMPFDCKLLLLQELGFSSDGTFVLDNKGERLIDIYTKEPVQVSNMAILPGSTIIVDDNPLSIASYLEEHSDVIGPRR